MRKLLLFLFLILTSVSFGQLKIIAERKSTEDGNNWKIENGSYYISVNPELEAATIIEPNRVLKLKIVGHFEQKEESVYALTFVCEDKNKVKYDVVLGIDENGGYVLLGSDGKNSN